MITESLLKSTEVRPTDNPFPGLRSFEFHESDLFFGRDGQSEELAAKLDSTHFLAVVGTSGSGKSSLVRAGLLPTLYGGLMGNTGSDWRIAIMRPGHNPISNLAKALHEPGGLGDPEEKQPHLLRDLTESSLRRGSSGLVEAVRHAQLDPQERILIVVDQFEELFRFARISEEETFANDAAAFVKLLLEAKDKEEIFIVITMRSEYIGDCAQFWDLPEAINKGQYLIPRMTRKQRKRAIMGPVEVREAKISPGLVTRLLNDMGDSPDRLPILQHALMRIWENWREGGQESAPLDLKHYERCGGLDEVLSRHADEAFKELPNARSQWIAEKLFKCLTEKEAYNRETRRPTELGEICRVAEASEAEVIAVIDVFRQEGRCFLMPSESVPLESSSSIDISHESLIGGWQKLKNWVKEEAYAGRVYRRLADDAVLYAEGDVLHGNRLQEGLEWREQNKPNAAWASRHHSSFYHLAQFSEHPRQIVDEEVFTLAIGLLEESQRARDKAIKDEQDRIRRAEEEKELKRQRELAEKEEQRRRELAEKEEQRKRELAEKEEQRRRELAEKEEQRRRAWQFAGAGAMLAIVIAIGLAVTLYFLNEKNRALQQVLVMNRLIYQTTMNMAQQAFQNNKWSETNQFLSRLPTPGVDEDLRGLDWYYLWRRSHDERTTLRAHSAEISSVAFSPDGKIIATGSYDQTARLWNPITSTIIELKDDHGGAVFSVAFSFDGKVLATGNADKTVKLWDVTGQKKKGELPASAFVRTVAFSPKSNTLAIGREDGTVAVWNTDAPEPQAREFRDKHQGYVSSVVFSPDGATIVSGSADGTVKLWDVNTGRPKYTLTAQERTILSVAISPDGNRIAAATQIGAIRLWKKASDQWKEEETPVLRAPATILSLVFVDNDSLITASDDAAIMRWDVRTGEVLRTLKGHSKGIKSVAVSPDRQTVVSGSADNTAKLWDLNSPPGTTILADYPEQVRSLTLSPNPGDRIAASGSGDGSIKLWDLQNNKTRKLQGPSPSAVLAIAFSSDGQRLASSGTDAKVKLWNVATGELVSTLTGHSEGVNSVAFSPDGEMLATGSDDKTVRLWNIRTGENLRTLTGHTGKVRSVAFSSDRKSLATGGDDMTVMLWDTRTGQNLITLTGHSGSVFCTAFSSDGKLLASGSEDSTAILWDAQTGNRLTTISGHSKAVTSVKFSPDAKNQRLATASSDGTIKFWDTVPSAEESMKRQELVRLEFDIENGKAPVGLESLAFSPDGKMIATARKDGSIVVCQGTTEEQVKMQR